ncbi:MAG: FeoB-associated Cys-rich membrane protein [Ruminococcaceae bacterium]|nr:FeoB-associated Cys-rich membrane protein [Oscillospiraceae bacterium]
MKEGDSVDNFLLVAVLVVVVLIAALYIIKQKKKGAKCIGCPYAGECASKNNCSCGCQTDNK